MSSERLPISNGATWYQLPVSEAMEALATSEAGLTSSEARTRLEKYGFNELRFKKRGALIRFLVQFRSALIYVLLASATITALMDMWVDTSVILLVVLANAIIGFVQEGKAEASMDALTGMMSPECMVLRDGERRRLPARELVPGDVVLLEEGSRAPADMRLFYARNLSIDEAALTGESVPVEKDVEPIQNPDLSPADQSCVAFSSTFVTRGSGRGVVVATGEKTEIGKIAQLLKETPRIATTPLMRKMAEFTKALVIGILVLAVLNFILGATLGGYDFAYSFLASVSFTVAAIPEGLPAILTIALAFGASAMSHRNALVRRLPAVETLGSATVICSDKTGTLTKNEMTVVEVYCGDKDYSVSGAGYEPKGQFASGGKIVDPLKETALAQTLMAGLLCNNAHLKQTNSRYEILGDPTEGALLVSAAKASIVAGLPRLDEVPFESHEQYMATLHQDREGNVIYVKGSPERVLGMCQTRLANGRLEPLDAQETLRRADKMAQGALRVLGLAYKPVPSSKTSLRSDDLEGLVFLGLQGMMDPAREEAIDAVAKCKRAGIRVVMITGDHALTAQAIAHQLGIDDGGRVLTGEELSRMSDEDLYEVVDQVSVYARVAPIHKFRVATQLQRRGHIVAMTGDGVNDAPALKAADLGIAMGIKGTDVTKEAADMILVDDNFASIVAAVEEGRHVFGTINKTILYTLPTNLGQALLIMGAILLVPFIPLFRERLPLEPVQILWINLYAAVALALPLLWEIREEGLLDRPPRDPKERIVNSLFLRKVVLVGLLMAASSFAVFYHFGMPALSDSGVDEGRLTQAQTAAFMTVMFVQVFYLLTARSLTKSVFSMNPFSNKWVLAGISITIVLHLIIVYALPHLGVNPFRTEPFPAQWWIFIILLSLPALFIIELEKFAMGRLTKRPRKA